MTEHNGTPTRAELLDIIRRLDVPRFRRVMDVDSEPDALILETMHRVRVEHPGINRVQRAASKRWLAEYGE